MGKVKGLNLKTYEEAADWFDTHDMADYEDQMQPVDFSFDSSSIASTHGVFSGR
jgi:hypothetical protein